jgi:hypothetical protein
MFTKENVISAKLINEEHTTIEVVHTIEGDDKVHSYILEYDKDSQDFKALEKAGWDLERVTEETVAYKRDTSRIYDESIHTAAMKFLHENPTEVIVEKNVMVTDIIGTIMANNEDEDMLFKAKLTTMELDIVKKSKDTKVKSNIRKAKSLIEVIAEINKL